MSRLPITWTALEPPRVPVAVLATGEGARRLAEAVRERLTPSSTLRVLASSRTLLVLGEAEELPWVDGATYLGREDGLLLPTTAAPSVPADLIRASLAARVNGREIAVIAGKALAFVVPAHQPDPGWLSEFALGRAP